MGCFAPSKVKRLALSWAPLPVTNTTTTTMATDPMIATTRPAMTSSCKTCKRWGPPCPLFAQSAQHPSPQESDWSDED